MMKFRGRVDDSCRKLTAEDAQKRGLPVFRDLGHSLSIAVTDMVRSPVRRKRLLPLQARQ